MEEPSPATITINVDTENEINTTSIPAPQDIKKQPLSETASEKTIELLKENIKSIETILISMKGQLTSIETNIIQQEKTNNKQSTSQVVLVQPKIKDTSLFNGGKLNQVKKIKMDIGFNIQRSITPELCDFMKLEKGSMTTLNEATKYIVNYINSHKLQNTTTPIMRKYINADEILCHLFNLGDNKKNILTYFNLPKYIHQHFTDQ
jgi:hypothetical protein